MDDDRAADLELIDEVFEAVIDDLRKSDAGEIGRVDGAVAALRSRSQPAFANVAASPVWPPIMFGKRQ